MEKGKHIVILAAGDFPTHEVPLRALHEADFVVCCDSAYGSLRAAAPDIAASAVVVGDGDSLPSADKAALGDRWLQVDEQDYNDLHKAMDWVMEAGGRRFGAGDTDLRLPTSDLKITILGATGRREDHTIGNISYLVTFAEEYPGADIEMLTDYGRFTAMTGSRTLATFPRQQVSIFTMNPDQAVYGTGLKWPLDGFRARRWWQATLNEALGTEVSLRSEGRLVVFLTYGPKS